MAGKSRIRILEERAQRILAQRRDGPMQKAIAAMTDEEIDQLLRLHETGGSSVMTAALQKRASYQIESN